MTTKINLSSIRLVNDKSGYSIYDGGKLINRSEDGAMYKNVYGKMLEEDYVACENGNTVTFSRTGKNGDTNV